MTLNERIESQSFAYDEQFPPDCAEGEPLSSMARKRPASHSPLHRALRACRRAVSPRRR